MNTFRLKLCLSLLLIFSMNLAAQESQDSVPADHVQRSKKGLQQFKSSVRGLLTNHCLECHGGRETKGDFNLSSRQSLMESGYVEAYKPAESQLLKLIRHEAEPYMPHKSKKLPDAAIKSIATWIENGAPYDRPLGKSVSSTGERIIVDADRQFWSFRPLQLKAPPQLPEDCGTTQIDAFVYRKLKENGLKPNPAAAKRTLLRRLYFDLLGLPPSPKEVDAFMADKSSNATEKVIDRLLQSKHYGERWARHWMDVARFAESHGYEQDYDRPHAYHYRDFLIKAFNQDMPFDQFVHWQIAGDELAPDDPLAMTATGFLGAGAFPTQLTEVEFEPARYDELDDMTATTSVAFMGLTVGCARCHDHKFDPIPARDYYAMAAHFTRTIRSEIDLAVEPKAKPVKVQVTADGFKPTKHHGDGRGFPHFYKQTFRLKRGDTTQKVEPAAPGFLQVLTRPGVAAERWKQSPPKDWKRSQFHRASLAKWLTDTNGGAGHLVARVIVNRLWHHHFGRGIVSTPSDFGFQGERPTHPELLDWLAADLIHNGWKLKRLHKMMLLSAVYQQASSHSPAMAKVDPDNRFVWRFQPKRLEAETIRDALLAVSGELEDKQFGPGTLDQKMKRRSVYFFIKRSKLIPMMMLFDWPEHLVSIGRRSTTTIAPQALHFMNSEQGRSFAKGLAKRVAVASNDVVVTNAYRMALGRKPSEKEMKLTSAFLKQQEQRYEAEKKKDARNLAIVDLCQTVLSSNEFIFVD